MKEILRSNIERKVKLTDDEFEIFFDKFKLISYDKKEHLLKSDSICNYYFFTVKGLVRSYYIDDKFKENITSFAIENWWITDLESFFNRSKSELNIQALEKTTVLAIQFDKLNQAFEEIPILNKFFRIQMQNMVVALQRKQDFYMKKEGKDRYEFFVKSLPDFIQRVPQYMLASYLDLTPEYLSELRKKPK